MNKLSRQLHPDKQFVTIGEIKVWDDNCKSFTFIPDPTRGTEELAFFKAGSYLSVFLDVNGMKLTRPYSISSSPQEALDGKVTLTIKRVPGGIASNYMLDHWKVGDKITLTGPLGEFVYLPVRDGSTVIPDRQAAAALHRSTPLPRPSPKGMRTSTSCCSTAPAPKRTFCSRMRSMPSRSRPTR